MIALTDKDVVIEGPTDPDLAKLWDLAVAKFSTRMGREPSTREDAQQVVQDYQKMLDKAQGSVATVIAQIVEERCSEVRGGD